MVFGVVLVAVAVAAAGVVFLPRSGGQGERGTFSPTGSMTAGRFWPSVTPLHDGRVLVAGGLDVKLEPMASAELYDPATGTFSKTGSMARPRAARVALLPDGRVLVAGGFADSDSKERLIATAELYDPRTATFSPTGSMATARSALATHLADGRVLVAGGGKAAGSSSAELYDPRTGTFSPTGSMTVARESPGVALLADGRVLVAGGREPLGDRLASAELYDPGTGAFSPAGSMATPRQVPATLLADGRVLVAGGREPLGDRLASAELYDPGTGAFSPTGSMTVARYWPSLALLPDGRVLVVGFSAPDGSSDGADSAELFQ